MAEDQKKYDLFQAYRCPSTCKGCRPVCSGQRKYHSNEGENYKREEKHGNETINKDDKRKCKYTEKAIRDTHSTTDSELPNKSKYLQGLLPGHSKCLQCNTLLQQVTGLLDDVQEIRGNEASGMCTHCNLTGLSIGCKKCCQLINSFLNNKVQEYQSQKEQFNEWLNKVKHVLRGILETDTVCKNKEHRKYSTTNEELENLLKQLQPRPMTADRRLRISHFPSTELETKSNVDLTDSADVLKKILHKIQKESERLQIEKLEGGIEQGETSIEIKTLPYLTDFNLSPHAQAKQIPLIDRRSRFAILPPSNEMLEQEFKKKIAKGLNLTVSIDNEKTVTWGPIRRSTGDVPGAVKGVDKDVGIRSIVKRSVKDNDYIRERSDREADTIGYKDASKVSDKVAAKGTLAKGTELKSALNKKRYNALNRAKEEKPNLKAIEKQKKDGSQIGKKLPEELEQTSSMLLTADKQQDMKTFAKQIASEKIKLNESTNKEIKEGKHTEKRELTLEDEKLTENIKDLKTTPSQTENSVNMKKSKLSLSPILTSKQPLTKLEMTPVLGKDKDNTGIKEAKEGKEEKDKVPGGLEKIFLEKATKGDLEIKGKKKKKKETADGDDMSDDDKENRQNKISSKKLKPTASTKLFLTLLKEKEKERAKKEKLERLNAKKIKEIKIPVIKQISLPKLSKRIKENDDTSSDGSSNSDATGGQGDVKCLDTEKIQGNKIVPYNYTKKELDVKPILFRKVHVFCPLQQSTNVTTAPEKDPSCRRKSNLSVFDSQSDISSRKGIMRYKLSNPEFIDNGITILPSMKIMRKMNVYKMVPTHRDCNWFQRHKKQKMLFYDSSEKLAEIDDDCHGRWYYRNGILALDYYKATEINAEHRYIVYSSGEKDALGNSRCITVLASFDHLGNGVAYDHIGNVRLKYNQTEGEVVDDKIGPPGRWKWHGLNDPPALHPVYIENLNDRDIRLQKIIANAENNAQEDKTNEDVLYESMLAIEFENYMKEKTNKLLQSYKPFQIRVKAFKLNEQFSLHVVDQANIYLMFRDGQVSLKLNLGMVLDNHEILDTETADVTQVMTSYDRKLPRSESVANIKRILVSTRKKFSVSSSVH